MRLLVGLVVRLIQTPKISGKITDIGEVGGLGAVPSGIPGQEVWGRPPEAESLSLHRHFLYFLAGVVEIHRL